MNRKIAVAASVILVGISSVANAQIWPVHAYHGLKPVGRAGPDPTHNFSIGGPPIPAGFTYSGYVTGSFLGTANQNTVVSTGIPVGGGTLNWKCNTTSGLYTASWHVTVRLVACWEFGCTSVTIGTGSDDVTTGKWVDKYPPAGGPCAT